MIYDCFQFYNEIDMLKIRMFLLRNVVDYHVIVESTRSHTGVEKPLHFKNHMCEFENYKDKIIHIVVDDAPPYSGIGDMRIENHLRNSIIRGLNRCQPDDVIIISDVDEIPNPRILERMADVHVKFGSIPEKKRSVVRQWAWLYSNTGRQTFQYILKNRNQSLWDAMDYSPIMLEEDLFHYFINYRATKKWYAPVISKFKMMSIPQRMREMAYLQAYPYIKDGGFHFSYLGGVEGILKKLEFFSENAVIKKDENESIENYLDRCIKNGLDIYGRTDYSLELVDLKSIILDDIDKVVEMFPYVYHQ